MGWRSSSVQPVDGQGRPPAAQAQAGAEAGNVVVDDSSKKEHEKQTEPLKVVAERKSVRQLPERTAAKKAELVASVKAKLAKDPDSLRVLGGWTFWPCCITSTWHSAKAFYKALQPLRLGGEPPMKLLKSSWVRRKANEMREAKKIEDPQRRAEAVARAAITYRQKMPKEAFMRPKDVKKQSNKISPDCCRLAAAGLSYCWELPTHPDPEGNSLLAIADALEEIYRKKEKRVGSYEYFPDDIGIFWDYPCLFQHPPGGKRTPEQDELFKWALSNLELIYAHEGTTVFRLIDSAPPTRAPYDGSGWPVYEGNSSRILKSQHGGVWPAVVDVGSEGIIDNGDMGIWGRMVPPPPSIRAFREKVPTLHFTNGADAELVADIYERMIRVALGGAVELVFVGAGWGAAEAASFAENLELCTRLESLNLRGNAAIGAAGLAALVKALGEEGVAPKLQTLGLGENDFRGADEAVRALGQAKLPALKELWLNDTMLSVAALAEGMPAGAWPSLEELCIENNEQPSDEGAEALARALERGAMPAVKRIAASRGTCSAADKAAIEKARPGLKVEI